VDVDGPAWAQPYDPRSGHRPFVGGRSVVAVSLLDVLISRRPDRPAAQLPRGYTTGALLAAAVVTSLLAGRRARDRR
jgi:hypothetical protein